MVAEMVNVPSFVSFDVVAKFKTEGKEEYLIGVCIGQEEPIPMTIEEFFQALKEWTEWKNSKEN